SYKMPNFKYYLLQSFNKALKPKGLVIVKPESIHGAPQYIGATLFSRKVHQFEYFYDKIANIEGDVIESGVWWGYGILSHLMFCRGYRGLTRKIYGFDSFQGHSEADVKDMEGREFDNPGSTFQVAESDVWQTLKLGTNLGEADLRKHVTLIAGWLHETLPRFTSGNRKLKVALVHSDMDLYKPVSLTLTHLWDLVVKGGIIILGRLNNPEYMGKTTAVEEFVAGLPKESYSMEWIEISELESLKPLRLYYLIKKV
ncbi:MAG: TylF/MycF family methyltransferase, partial [Pseudobdellovibrionaceae bacterium]|nr:TylF/MycF family methyltransferase [Pseudobdellovibrionaceae bacterium]